MILRRWRFSETPARLREPGTTRRQFRARHGSGHGGAARSAPRRVYARQGLGRAAADRQRATRLLTQARVASPDPRRFRRRRCVPRDTARADARGAGVGQQALPRRHADPRARLQLRRAPDKSRAERVASDWRRTRTRRAETCDPRVRRADGVSADYARDLKDARSSLSKKKGRRRRRKRRLRRCHRPRLSRRTPQRARSAPRDERRPLERRAGVPGRRDLRRGGTRGCGRRRPRLDRLGRVDHPRWFEKRPAARPTGEVQRPSAREARRRHGGPETRPGRGRTRHETTHLRASVSGVPRVRRATAAFFERDGPRRRRSAGGRGARGRAVLLQRVARV